MWHREGFAPPPLPHLIRHPGQNAIWEAPMASKTLKACNGHYTEYVLNDPKATFILFFFLRQLLILLKILLILFRPV